MDKNHHSPSEERILPPLWILTLLGIYGFWWLLTELRELTALMIVGYAIAFALDPLLDWFEKKKISRTVGFFVVTAGIILVGTLFFTIALPPLISEVENFIHNVPHYTDTIGTRLDEMVGFVNKYLPPAQKVSLSKERLMKYTSLIDGTTIKATFFAFFGFLLEGYSFTLTLLNLALLPFIIYYLAIDIDTFHTWCIGLAPRRYRRNLRGMFLEINQYLRAFVVGQSTVALILTVLYAIGFAITGHSQWLLLSVVSGIGNLIPYIGTISGIILSAVFCLTSDDPTSMAIKTVIVFSAVQFLEGTFITPKIVGEKVGLSPLLVILAILIGGKLFGLIGIFLAVPVAAACKVLGGYVHRALLARAGEEE